MRVNQSLIREIAGISRMRLSVSDRKRADELLSELHTIAAREIEAPKVNIVDEFADVIDAIKRDD